MSMDTHIVERGAAAPSRITRLPFKLREFSRVIWVSELAKAVWEPRISAISNVCGRLETRAAETGMRPSALKSVVPEHLTALAAQAAKYGMVAVPLAREGSSGQSYQSASMPFAEGQPWTYRVAYTRPELAGEWIHAWAIGDHEKVGALLGYPECCSKFFRHFWVGERYVDTTYPMSLGGTEGPVEANHMLRWLGVRLVPHLPHSHDCEETVRQANEYLALGRQEGHGQEMDWALEMLAWPVEWSALHGIAEICLPILKINALTDATAHKLVIRREGTKYPAEGARGIKFPYLPPVGVQLTKGRSFAKSMEGLEAEWKQNGFGSREAMEKAHAGIMKCVQQHAIPAGLVVDPGCGNGRLLEEVLKLVPGGTPGGMDADRERALAAKRRMQNGDFMYGDLHDEATWPQGRYSLTLFYPGRLHEEPDMVRRELTRARLLDRSDRILFYVYRTEQEHDVLQAMQDAGLDVGTIGPVVRTPDVEAVMILVKRQLTVEVLGVAPIGYQEVAP